jgi:thiol-disulfide isomerase/thioredoxin
MSNIHEYSIIEKIKDIEAKNMMFSIPYLAKIKKSEKKIQFISFFAEWCPNCEFEAINLKTYIDRYSPAIGFSIVMQFSSNSKSKKFVSKFKLNSKLIEPECLLKDENLNKETSFYKFRKVLNDERKWGVPFHIIRIIKQKGEEIFVIKGESRKEDLQNFLDRF